jgi:hypothetical protein
MDCSTRTTLTPPAFSRSASTSLRYVLSCTDTTVQLQHAYLLTHYSYEQVLSDYEHFVPLNLPVPDKIESIINLAPRLMYVLCCPLSPVLLRGLPH